VLAAVGFLVNGPRPAAVAGEKPKPDPRLAPELDGGVAWINTAAPIKLADLRGRVVLLDFWTLCCINCIHTLPDLAKLEAKYPGILVVLGIHTPKFPNEKMTESIRKAVLRYQVSHPVVNDADAIIWRRYGVNSWPTLVLIDPEGRYYGQVSGEGAFNVLDEHIGKLVKEYRAKKMLNERPLRFQLARTTESGDSPLYFPGKVLADKASDRLFPCRRHPLRRRSQEPSDPRAGPQGPYREGGRRHRNPGARGARPGRAGAPHGAEQPVGPADPRPQVVHRHGGAPPDLDARPGPRRRGAIRRQRP
jgi:thiol-disulfide isomerase/thioredoxin